MREGGREGVREGVRPGGVKGGGGGGARGRGGGGGGRVTQVKGGEEIWNTASGRKVEECKNRENKRKLLADEGSSEAWM